MKKFVSFVLGVSLCAVAPAGVAEQMDVETLKQQILKELKPAIDAEVERRVREELAKRPVTAAPATADLTVPAAERTARAWSPSQPLPLFQAGPAYLNLSAVGDVVLGWSTTPDVEDILGAHHDPSQRGFTLTGFEIALEGAVDPYFKGLAAIALVIDPDGETEIELEEAYLQTTSLPWNLQVKAGQFFAAFGQHNALHNHQWAFVDQPIVITRLLGPDALRNPGAQLSWLTPLPFFAELSLGIFNSSGETAFSFNTDESEEIHGGEPVDRSLRGPQDLLFVPRLAMAFDLTDTQTLLLGASAAIGPNNSGPDGRTHMVGGDLVWRWRPVNAERGFPFVQAQTEFIYRHYRADERESAADPLDILPKETLRDWGFYSQLLYGFRPGWVAGLRGDFISGDHGMFDSEWRLDRTRIAPNLTWYPTEFSKLRLQYNYDHIQGEGDEHSVWLQLEFILGAHAAHKFGQ